MGDQMDNTVSKEEMDALLREEKTGDAESLLSPSELNTLAELFWPAFEAIGTALSTILKSEVKIRTPEVKTAGQDRLKGELKEDVFVAEFSYAKPFSGLTYIIVGKKAGAIVADLMMGGDGTSAPDEINELYLGAVGEVISQMMNSSISVLSSLIGSQVSVSSPRVRVANLGEADVDLALLKEKSITQISSKMKIDGLVEESPLIQLISISLAKAIISAKRAPAITSGAVHPVQFAPLRPGGTREVSANIDLLMDVPMKVSVELGRTSMLIKDILQLGVGGMVELDKMAGEPVDFLVNGKLIAKGNAVVIDEYFGLRITDIISPSERLDSLKQEF